MENSSATRTATGYRIKEPPLLGRLMTALAKVLRIVVPEAYHHA